MFYKISLVTALFALAVAIASIVIVSDTKNMERGSLIDRVETLEMWMREKSRPIIQVQQATIYNGTGEIILEMKEEK